MIAIARRITLFGMLAMAMAMAGCGDDDDDGIGPADITGTYLLRSVNGDPLPYTLFEGGGFKSEIVSSQLVLNAGGTWTQVAQIRDTESGSAPVTTPENSSGTYVRNGRTLVLTDQDDDQLEVTIQNDGALILAGDGLTARFTK
jgi:hypothetical protein